MLPEYLCRNHLGMLVEHLPLLSDEHLPGKLVNHYPKTLQSNPLYLPAWHPAMRISSLGMLMECLLILLVIMIAKHFVGPPKEIFLRAPTWMIKGVTPL
ncbi:hypothetical protein PoB_000252000 [Plakobranchus ocellatus]|uniref:Uncharacterized protein n=1 Tax=Plakobranchus ocellatus TaxID=259542 RepID=A0AAV3XZY0_9GAST|nr:hypothetical protein PoB_000252000 [Plakobranchus ocellatus]